MLFNSSKYTLFIESKKISIVESSRKVTTVFESDWSPTTFLQVIVSIKKKFGVNFRIVLSEELTYVTAIELPQELSLSKDVIEKAVQGTIPEHLNETVWGYKEVLTLQRKKGENLRLIQIAALTRTVSDIVRITLPRVGIHIESLIPISYVCARFAPITDGYILVVNLNLATLLIMSEKGFVIASEYHVGAVTGDQVISFMNFIERKFFLAPNTIILSSTVDITIEEQLKQTGKKIDRRDVLPYSEVLKTNFASREGLDLASFFLNSINSTIRRVTQTTLTDRLVSNESSAVEFADQRDYHSRKILFILLGLLIIAIIIFIGVLQLTIFKTGT